MTLIQILLNLLFALLVFFLVRYIGGMVAPEGNDKDKLVTVVAVMLAVAVFLLNFASQSGVH
jgi:ABC-type Na+ efflux pump permease subunit